MLTASPRRAYTSRAFWSADSASTAWTLPACSCGAPPGACVNTSQSGHWPSPRTCSGPFAAPPEAPASFPAAADAPMSGRLRGRRLTGTLGRVRRRRHPHPLPLRVRRAPRGEPLAVARPVAAQHPVELVPVDRPEVPVPRLLVVVEVR